jgi:transcriptional regulator with XRE-family HTH domain
MSIREHRSRIGLTQQQLADAAGLSIPAISRAERGKTRPNRGTLALLATVFGVDHTDLIPPQGGPQADGP